MARATTNIRRKAKRDLVCVATIGGEYHQSKGTTQELHPYEIECKFDQDMIEKGVLSVFKNTLAPILMPKQFPGYQGLYTHEIRGSYMVDESGEEWEVEDRRLMNRDQLIEYTDTLSNPSCEVDADIYVDAGSLRQAVDDWLEAVRSGTTADYIKAQDKRREKHGEDIALATRALALNEVDADPKSLLMQQSLAEFASGSETPQQEPSGKSKKSEAKADKTLSKI